MSWSDARSDPGSICNDRTSLKPGQPRCKPDINPACQHGLAEFLRHAVRFCRETDKACKAMFWHLKKCFSPMRKLFFQTFEERCFGMARKLQ
jgi:hypothetical protein